MQYPFPLSCEVYSCTRRDNWVNTVLPVWFNVHLQSWRTYWWSLWKKFFFLLRLYWWLSQTLLSDSIVCNVHNVRSVSVEKFRKRVWSVLEFFFTSGSVLNWTTLGLLKLSAFQHSEVDLFFFFRDRSLVFFWTFLYY